MKLSIWSNLALLIPAYLAFHFKIYWHALLVITAMGLSLLYHWHERKKYNFADSLFAVLVIGANTWIFFTSKFNISYFILILMFIAIAFFFFFRAKRNYEFNHAMWHLSCAVITFLCVAAHG